MPLVNHQDGWQLVPAMQLCSTHFDPSCERNSSTLSILTCQHTVPKVQVGGGGVGVTHLHVHALILCVAVILHGTLHTIPILLRCCRRGTRLFCLQGLLQDYLCRLAITTCTSESYATALSTHMIPICCRSGPWCEARSQHPRE